MYENNRIKFCEQRNAYLKSITMLSFMQESGFVKELQI